MIKSKSTQSPLLSCVIPAGRSLPGQHTKQTSSCFCSHVAAHPHTAFPPLHIPEGILTQCWLLQFHEMLRLAATQTPNIHTHTAFGKKFCLWGFKIVVPFEIPKITCIVGLDQEKQCHTKFLLIASPL